MKRILDFVKGETGLYIVFGGLTTVVNYVFFWLSLKLSFSVIAANTIAFIFAVAFAYATNKIYVFKSRSWKLSLVFKEIISFIASRIFSFLFETAGLWLTEDIIKADETGVLIAKVILSVGVIIINWVLSKFIVFRKK
ncbi:MAG: GtrA family protein [Clostridia bacterium]|nr:GtrA family protein [Clostridia bacterium]